MRIGLHSGPVFEKEDPFTHQKNLYGAHVNRAARIEPITKSGSIYASEQFVAMLIEEKARKVGFDMSKFPYSLNYVGTVPLAKNFGTQAVYLMESKLQPKNFTKIPTGGRA